jgi:hypothetical protein
MIIYVQWSYCHLLLLLSRSAPLILLLNIILLLGRWCAGLQPPTICAKSYMAYNAFRHYYKIKLQNGVLLAANALFS